MQFWFVWHLHQSLVQHGIDHPHESGNIGAGQVVAGFAVFFGHIQTVLVNVFDNGLQTLIDTQIRLLDAEYELAVASVRLRTLLLDE